MNILSHVSCGLRGTCCRLINYRMSLRKTSCHHYRDSIILLTLFSTLVERSSHEYTCLARVCVNVVKREERGDLHECAYIYVQSICRYTEEIFFCGVCSFFYWCACLRHVSVILLWYDMLTWNLVGNHTRKHIRLLEQMHTQKRVKCRRDLWAFQDVELNVWEHGL